MARVLYFFCDNGDSTKRTAIGILRSLIAQLVPADPLFVSLAREAIIQSGQGSASSFSRLMSLFKSLMERSKSEIHVVIDGLDECIDEPQGGLLRKLIDLTTSSPLRLAVFSRSEPWIYPLVSTWPSIEINAQAIQEDMILYLGKVVERPPISRFSLAYIDLPQRIIQVLMEKADGQFLWTRLMVEMLEKASFVSEISQILSDVPRGLGQMYDRILEKLLLQPGRRQESAQLLLSWLACAERHMTVSELATALSVRSGASEVDPDDMILDLRSFLEEVCGSLVRVSEPNTDQSEAIVNFVHLTVREYLLASEELCMFKSTPVVKFRIDVLKANHLLASTCITYLSFDIFKQLSGDETSRRPHESSTHHLLDYAAMYWVPHLVKSGQPTPDLLRRLCSFLKSDQLLAYIERTVSINNAGFSISNLLVSQSLLNEWIHRCDGEDPRLAMVTECFYIRLESTLQERKRLLGNTHSDTIEAKFQLAQLLVFRGQWRTSATLHREVMNARERIAGKCDRSSINSMHCLASVLTRLGDYHESQCLHEKALKLCTVEFGKNDPDTLRSEDGLAKTFKEQGALENAEVMARATLVKKERVFGKSSLEAVLTTENLAAILKDTGLSHRKEGNETLALQAFWECEAISRNDLAVREAQLGEENPQTMNCVNMLGIVLRHLYRPQESEQYHRRALQTRLRIFGPNNPHTQRSMRNLGAVLQDQGRLRETQEIEQMFRASQRIDPVLVEREHASKTACRIEGAAIVA